MEEPVQRRTAVALQSDLAAGTTPVVTAAGQGWVAEDIIALAREHGVPVHEDPELVQVLSQVQVGEEIPAVLYQVVAELLVFLYWVDAGAGVENE
ncbi:MAG: flagellar biosynthesis protein FlhB [Dehalococcoidia bacterium]|nr:flagellar biosynthesis protein FlhB [Dehalococcoidia bacterium]